MTTAAAAGTDVDSTEQQQADEQGPTRRKIVTESLGAGERRRVVDVQIGGYEYDARCPKLVVWTDLAQIIADQRGNRSDRRKAGDKQPAGEGRVTTDRIRLTQAMTHFLRGCLTSADWEAIEVDLADPDDDLDIPDLWAAGVKLIVEFKPDMQDMANRIGMKVPAVLDQLGPDTINQAHAGEQAPPPAAPRSRPRKGAGGRAR
jgi:hypothetical protein